MSRTIHIIAPDLASAWITAMKRVFFEGETIRTEYDKNETEPSFDFTALIEIQQPLLPGKSQAQPHKADVYGVMSIRGGYLEEILEGSRDSQILESATSYPYTYHDRLFAYKAYNLEDKEDVDPELHVKDVGSGLPPILKASELQFPSINQIDYIVEKLKEAPYSRRAQGITWRPMSDPRREDCPCLQRIWARVINGKLHLQTSWRSRDLYRALGANCVGMISMQKMIADRLGVEIGSYADFTNSLHIYGQRKVIEEVIHMFERLQKREGLEPEYAKILEERKKQFHIEWWKVSTQPPFFPL